MCVSFVYLCMIWIHLANSLMWNFSIRHMFGIISISATFSLSLIPFSLFLSPVGVIFSFKIVWMQIEKNTHTSKYRENVIPRKRKLSGTFPLLTFIPLLHYNFSSCMCMYACALANKSEAKEEKKFGIILCSKDHAEGMARNGKSTTYTHKIALIVLCCSSR